MGDVAYFAIFDADGYPEGFFPSDIWPTPPDGATEITTVQYQRLLDGNCRYVDGDVVDAPSKPAAEAST
jgi:hypothetical protein